MDKSKEEVEQTKMEKLRAEMAQLKSKVQGYEQQFETKVSDNPVTSVGLAFGTGVLVGAVVSFLMSRK